ncbi:MAG TPA: O-antigen translocase [Verrucomicrobiae bacterium]|nr:O-antigen translocase [Verrucomicrobiae bacterium]
MPPVSVQLETSVKTLNKGEKSYGQIVKSSVLIGGSSVLNVGFSIVRTKAMALLLGPSGYGLFGVYDSICNLTRTVAGMGINTSGVRQIAEAVGTGDSRRIACTVITLRRVAFYTGALGALFLLACSKPLSLLTFGDSRHVAAIALLALAAFFGDVSAGQGAVIQGMRRIADLARMNVLGALYGTVFSIVIVYLYYRHGIAEQGVVPALVCAAAMGILMSWWYARKIRVETVRITTSQVMAEASALLKLGFVFMASSLMVLGTNYLIRIFALRGISLEAAGFYQAAWAFSVLYVNFILQAMGTDFYPRLTAIAGDREECNRLVNEQAEVGLLAACPGVLATLAFAPLVIGLFYSAKFAPAVEILRWFCLGMMLRVASWPMGFILLARGAGKIFFWTELSTNLVSLGLTWFGIRYFALNGIGMAFFVTYVVYFVLIYAVVRRVCGFKWSGANRRLGLLFTPLIAVVFASWYFLPRWAAIALGLISAGLAGVYSLKTLCALLPLERFPGFVRKLIVFFRLTSPGGDAHH